MFASLNRPGGVPLPAPELPCSAPGFRAPPGSPGLVEEAVLAVDQQADDLAQKIGPEYVTMMDGLPQIDENSSEGKQIEAALDSLEAPRYLKDSEEYWPFEGDDWPDEDGATYDEMRTALDAPANMIEPSRTRNTS